MRGKKSTEIEQLDAGLAQAGEDWVPKAIEKELEPKTPEDLLHLSDLGDRLEDAVRIRNGWIYIMLRRKVGHGNFKKYLEQHHRRYFKAWEAMCYARAAARHPALAAAVTGNAIRHILALPESGIHKIEESITGLPADEAKKITRDWIEREYRKIQAERKPKRKPPKELPPMPDFDQELDTLVIEANRALLDISEHPIDPRHKEQALKAVRQLALAWERASYNLADPEHKTTPRWEMDPVERALDGIGDEEEAPL